MIRLSVLILNVAFLLSIGDASMLYVASYGGNITTVNLGEQLGNYYIEATYENTGCAPNPSWLTLDPCSGLLYCLDEGLETPNGSLNSFTVNADGSLSRIDRMETLSGPVSGIVYGDPAKRQGIALAHYSGNGISTWAVNAGSRGKLAPGQNIIEKLDKPGANPARQEAPHEHEAITDPTGQYLLFPDLGADLVRVYAIDPDNLALTPMPPLSVAPGSGPRHAVFYQPFGVTCENCTSYLYVVSELGNTVTSYAVTYPACGGMAFQQVWQSSVYGPLTLPAGNAPAEIAISPDNRYMVISNRNNTSFALPTNTDVKFASDSLSTFELNFDGSANFYQLAPAGGSFPRHFSMNKYGSLIAVGLQNDGAVAIMQRDVSSGLIGNMVARIDIPGNVTNVMWWN